MAERDKPEHRPRRSRCPLRCRPEGQAHCRGYCKTTLEVMSKTTRRDEAWLRRQLGGVGRRAARESATDMGATAHGAGGVVLRCAPVGDRATGHGAWRRRRRAYRGGRLENAIRHSPLPTTLEFRPDPPLSGISAANRLDGRRSPVIIEPDYRGHRMESNAVA